MTLSLMGIITVLVLSFVAGIGFTLGAWLMNKVLR